MHVRLFLSEGPDKVCQHLANQIIQKIKGNSHLRKMDMAAVQAQQKENLKNYGLKNISHTSTISSTAQKLMYELEILFAIRKMQ